jgi:hypothetical protein
MSDIDDLPAGDVSVPFGLARDDLDVPPCERLARRSGARG